MRKFRNLLFLIVVLAFAPRAPAGAEPWVPSQGLRFDVQFTRPFNFSRPVDFLDLDLFDTTAQTIASLKARGVRLACYINAGAWENWRPDAGRYPAEVLGRDYVGWPGERWVDIRRIDLLAPILEARLDLCRAKGFDTVDPDNLNGYENDTGFPLTAEDQLRFNRWLANAAHARGLSIGLKNTGLLADRLVNDFDWALVESCYTYNECQLYMPFRRARKAVFVIEYTQNRRQQARFCALNRNDGFGLVFKKRNLDGWLARCP
ncbi:MAG: endo alpha-1,4 polygalactosaminidase [Geminicoccaceae bacterium]|nr:endo alpha-1,4 polygalactosaminidase [Geminicoccaceae bacterium]MCS7269038.1 endo alpha-1,4 polygalactosaminidase [Geminicoccaceae bacterium]MCX7631014.1 endo alpha-1,4 polygalactosaminidase [Geminicoccaceae bacterium]MDW8125460.1 endo alpha-1,4 polygalactosaminidase [Geminicoccaceae bacterium]MDW8341967.1 endo alpha-1,4 polygalactosaminidase [Geminicoccaceae bacterium]